MIHLIDILIQWFTKGQLPQMDISRWLDAIITFIVLTFILLLVYYTEKRVQNFQEREKAIDDLIESHKE